MATLAAGSRPESPWIEKGKKRTASALAHVAASWLPHMACVPLPPPAAAAGGIIASVECSQGRHEIEEARSPTQQTPPPRASNPFVVLVLRSPSGEGCPGGRRKSFPVWGLATCEMGLRGQAGAFPLVNEGP